MLRACESSDKFKESLEEEHRSMAQFHIDCVEVSVLLLQAYRHPVGETSVMRFPQQ